MLRNARKAKGLSQKTLAERLGVTQSYISRLENRGTYTENVTIELIRKISVELNLEPVKVFLYFYGNSKD